ncbi:hypothetical protein M2150_002109 [Lachnospiraceae bacterium PM6-15]
MKKTMTKTVGRCRKQKRVRDGVSLMLVCNE